jgi:glycosyltransferase involved in cell wall biosynthesis
MKGARGYDRCLFVLDGTAGCLHAIQLLTRVPGTVLMQDVRLLELYRELQRHRYWYWPVWLEDRLMAFYGDRVSRPAIRGVAYAGRADNRIVMTGEAQENAERILVHSREQAELLEFDRRGRPASVEVVPFAIPSTSMHSPSSRNGPPLLLSSGPSTPALQAAFTQIRHDHPGARLEQIEDIGEAELANADLALNLRRDGDAGRPAGEVAELIAAGVPTFVSDVGWQGELPEPVVIKVPVEGSAGALADRISSVLSDEQERSSIRAAQREFALENSFARVAERYAELLGL